MNIIQYEYVLRRTPKVIRFRWHFTLSSELESYSSIYRWRYFEMTTYIRDMIDSPCSKCCECEGESTSFREGERMLVDRKQTQQTPWELKLMSLRDTII